LYDCIELYDTVIYIYIISGLLHEKNGFAKISKNLDTDLKIILDHENNYVGRSN